MKILLAVLFAISSTSAFARQYIQCSNKDPHQTDVMVVNLTSPVRGTLFLSSGMQNPDDERILVSIELEKNFQRKSIYRITSGGVDGFLSVPETVIGKPSNDFFIELVFNGYEVVFSCFSRLYEDN